DYQLPYTFEDLSGLAGQDKSRRLAQIPREQGQQAFQLNADLMLRVKVLRLSAEAHLVIYVVHHIASDGWSMGIIRRELNALYEAYRNGQANPLKALPVQYVDYGKWQRDWLRGEVLRSHLDYWRGQ